MLRELVKVDKAPDAFRTISEVADELDVPQHVLRFWETRFPQIKPMKRGGGRRYYRPEDVDLVRGIRHLLYGEGYTIRGVQRLLKDNGIKFVQGIWRSGAAPADPPREEDADAAESKDNGGRAESASVAPAASERVAPPVFVASPSAGADAGITARPRMSRANPVPIPRIEPQLPSPSAPAKPQAEGAARMPRGLSDEDRGRLQAAMHDLEECQRLLDAELKEPD